MFLRNSSGMIHDTGSLFWSEVQSCHYVTAFLCVNARRYRCRGENKCVYRLKTRPGARVCVCAWMWASIHTHVCLRTCVSFASYVLMSQDRRTSLMLTKIRVLFICSVNCSALLNYSRAGKSWGLPFLSSLSLSLVTFRFQDMTSGRRMKAPASLLSACHCVIHWPPTISSRLFPCVCVCVHLRSRCPWITSNVIEVGGVTCHKSHAHSQIHTYVVFFSPPMPQIDCNIS